MRVITARNVHQALPLGLRLLEQEGIRRESRNGPVLQAPWPVTTVYERPCERVIFWPERDANPFFHLYESLWMLDGRKDLAPLVRYAKNMASFSDDGDTLHGAYGRRWRSHFRDSRMEHDLIDQLRTIATTLRLNPDDRRCILQMWDPAVDLARIGKDVPCNVTASFQRDSEGKLDITVFCRSNDIVWGAYGANAVHFSMLLEYMALWIGCPVGVYRQVSVNWHGYLSTLAPLEGKWRTWIDTVGHIPDPYETTDPRFEAGIVRSIPMTADGDIAKVTALIQHILRNADHERLDSESYPSKSFSWAYNVWRVLQAHEAFRRKERGVARFDEALDILDSADSQSDWVVAASLWLHKRKSIATGEPQSAFYPRTRYGSKL